MGIFGALSGLPLEGSDRTCIDASLGDSQGLVTLTLFQGQRGTDSTIV